MWEFSIFIWMIEVWCVRAGRGGRVEVEGRGFTLERHWMLINLRIDNPILLRNGQNNTRFLCIKVDLYVLSGSRLLLLPLLLRVDRWRRPYARRRSLHTAAANTGDLRFTRSDKTLKGQPVVVNN